MFVIIGVTVWSDKDDGHIDSWLIQDPVTEKTLFFDQKELAVKQLSVCVDQTVENMGVDEDCLDILWNDDGDEVSIESAPCTVNFKVVRA